MERKKSARTWIFNGEEQLPPRVNAQVDFKFTHFWRIISFVLAAEIGSLILREKTQLSTYLHKSSWRVKLNWSLLNFLYIFARCLGRAHIHLLYMIIIVCVVR